MNYVDVAFVWYSLEIEMMRQGLGEVSVLVVVGHQFCLVVALSVWTHR